MDSLGEAGATESMWFKVLSLLIGVPCILKGVIGLSMPDRFYRWMASPAIDQQIFAFGL